jgi:hypothetical protein
VSAPNGRLKERRLEFRGQAQLALARGDACPIPGYADPIDINHPALRHRERLRNSLWPDLLLLVLDLHQSPCFRVFSFYKNDPEVSGVAHDILTLIWPF